MSEGLMAALAHLADPMAIAMLLLGTLLGIVFGALPGFSSFTGMALALPFTYGMNPLDAMLLFAGITGSIQFGGSIPAILLNTPGTGTNACTIFDGFPMAQRGEAARALSISAMSALLGSLLGVLVLVILMPVMQQVVLAFGLSDQFWLVVFGLVAIAFAAKGNLLRGLVMGGIGILVSLIGYSSVFSGERYTLGIDYLWDGIPLGPLFIGLFALSEVIIYAARKGTISHKTAIVGSTWRAQVFQGIRDTLSRPVVVLRSAAIGSLVGLTPGIGGAVANFISYSVAKQATKHPEEFGHGSIEGLIASEVANDAKDGPAVVPTVAFGIPGSADMAILLGALTVHGLWPGPLLLRDNVQVVWMIVLGLILTQVITSGVGLLAAGSLARLTLVPTHYLAPFVALLCMVGAFAMRFNVWDVLLTVLIGAAGFALKRFGFPVIPLAIGYILGVRAELSLHTAVKLSYGSYYVGLFQSKISWVLIALIILTIGYPFFRAWRMRRLENSLAEDQEFKTAGAAPINWSRLCFTALLTLLVLGVVITATGYRPDVRTVPLAVGVPTLVVLLYLVVAELRPQLLHITEVSMEAMWGGRYRTSTPAASASEPDRLSGNLLILGYLFLLSLLILFVGFVGAALIFTMLYLRIQGNVGWRPVIISGLAAATVAFGLNFLLPGGQLWTGIIPMLLPGIIGGGRLPLLF